MSIRKVLRSAAVVAALAIVAGASAFAQAGAIAPSGQLGVGINTQGGTIQYAASPSIQVGLALNISSTSVNSSTQTTYGIGPYARFILEGTVNPFIQAGLNFGGNSVGGTSTSSTSIYAGLGLEYFATRFCGIQAMARLINLGLSPSPTSTTFGLEGAQAGVEWYFSR